MAERPVAYAVPVDTRNTTTTITRESDGDCSERGCAIATLVIIALTVIGAILGTCDSPYLDQNLSTGTVAATTGVAAGLLGAAANRTTPVYHQPVFGHTTTTLVRRMHPHSAAQPFSSIGSTWRSSGPLSRPVVLGVNSHQTNPQHRLE